MTVRAIRLYEVTVDGYGVGKVLAASPAKARYAAYRNDAFDQFTFRQFQNICRVRLARPSDSDGYERLRSQYPACVIPAPGTRIKAEGHVGTTLPPAGPTSYVVFQPDGKEYEVHVHPLSVELELCDG